MMQDNQRETVLRKIQQLKKMHATGMLGGEVMPEDANPHLQEYSRENYLYFSLPMALNYQRDSYKLWEAACKTYCDEETREIFNPEIVVTLNEDQLRASLLKYKLALQPNKHLATWRTLCQTIHTLFKGDIRNLFLICHRSIPEVLEFVQKTHKKGFPYLSGPKICHYWLFVMNSYTDAGLSGKTFLTIAPDTHVIQATIRLGLIDQEHLKNHSIQDLVNQTWRDVLKGTEHSLIDLHTPLWLWSRNGFREVIE